MHLRHLRYFATVADEGSVLRAATRLRVAQPALSRQIRQLESELGVVLFDRERHGVRITAAGAALRDGARRVFARLDSAIDDARDAHEGRVGTVYLGLSQGALMNGVVAAGLQAVRAQLPNAEVVLSELPIRGQSEALRSRDADLVIGPGVDRVGEFRNDVLYSVHVDSVLLPARLVGDTGSLDADQLRESGWLVSSALERMPSLGKALDRIGLRYELVESEETALALVMAGRGWIPVGARFGATAPPETRVVPVRGLDIQIPMALRSRRQDDSRLLENVRSIMLSAVIDAASPSATNGRHSVDRVPAIHIELRQLRAFTAVVAERSLTRAARRLGLSQSAVSRQLQSLEQQLQCTLLHHPIRDATPTAAGQLFAKEAAAVRTLAEGAITRSRRVARGITGVCIVGTLASEVTNGLLPTKLTQLAERHPEVAIELREMVTNEQITALLDRKIDVGVLGSMHQEFDEAALTSVAIADDPVEAVMVSESNPLAAKTWLQAKDLSGHPFIFMPRQRNALLYDAVLRGLIEAGVIPNTGGSYSGVRVLWGALSVTGGWTVASRSLAAKPPRGLVARPLEGFSVPWGVRLAWRRDETDAAVQKVLNIFRTAS